MKNLIIIAFTILLSNLSFGQTAGNINYQTKVQYSNNNINIPNPSYSSIISVKGLANVKADSYVAIFSVVQVGKTTEEVNNLIDKRIDNALAKINSKSKVTTFIDMISFVPVYTYEVQKKIFSKKTYNEIPAGFELKKNIHIKYTDPNILNKLITILSSEEVYDLVRVDYFSSQLEAIKKELMLKSKTVLQEKINNYHSFLPKDSFSFDKNISDGFRVVLPVEMYQSYQSYNSSSLNLRKPAKVNNVNKTTTLYYQPVLDKEFDFVINSTILEPVIQVMYEVKMNIVKTKLVKIKEVKATKSYILVTPNGDLKTLNLN